jgi:hypothetical protein
MSPLTKAELGRLLNLDFFVNAFVTRERPIPDRKDLVSAFALTRDAERFEALAWLTLCSQRGCFPSNEAIAVLGSDRGKLLPSSQEGWAVVESLFPGHNDLLRIVRDGKVEALTKAQFERVDNGSPLTTAVLKTSLLLGADMANDNVMRSFTAALLFTTDGYWTEEILGPSIDPNEVMLVLAADESLAGSFAPEVVCAGLVRAISYIDRFQSIFQGIGEQLDDASIPELRQKVSSIVGWRINISTRRARLLDLVEKISKEIDKCAVERWLENQFGLRYFAINVLKLIKYWNGEPLRLTAGAS